MKKRIFIGIVIIVYSIGCSQAQFHMSHPSSALIDGNLSEWADQLVVPEGSKIAVGIKHDDKNIYIALGLIDQMAIMQAVNRGFTVWFDPTGKKKKQVGIHYPLQDKNRPPMGMEMGQSQMNPDDMEYILKSQLEGQYFFEYLENEGKTAQQIGLENDLGIQIKAQYQYGEFSYELQIPFEMITDNIGDDAQISIGITTPEMNREDMGMRKRPDGGMGGQKPSGGGMGGGMGRGGGKGGPGGGRSGMQRPDPLNLWLNVGFDTK